MGAEKADKDKGVTELSDDDEDAEDDSSVASEEVTIEVTSREVKEGVDTPHRSSSTTTRQREEGVEIILIESSQEDITPPTEEEAEDLTLLKEVSLASDTTLTSLEDQGSTKGELALTVTPMVESAPQSNSSENTLSRSEAREDPLGPESASSGMETRGSEEKEEEGENCQKTNTLK